MKKYLISGALALIAIGSLTSCHSDDDLTNSAVAQKMETYEQVFKEEFGTIDPNQDWGFGAVSIAARTKAAAALTRSQNEPFVAGIAQPYSESWVTSYCSSATEPNDANTTDNYDNSSYATNWDVVNNLTDDQDKADKAWLFDQSGYSWEQQIEWMLQNHPTWLVYNKDTNFVLNFKITGTYDGEIRVAGSEGINDGGSLSGAERTIVVTGTWNITENQRIGSLGKIVIAEGGTVNVASGVTLNMVNQARLVILKGGTLTGAGKVEVNNGNSAGKENYNGGTVSVATFNNNFGKFYNYGKFLVTEYQGGAQESNFYNHSLVHIQHTGLGSETPNARIFNACQWYCEGDMRMRNYEGISGSALIVGGQLMISSSEDGTTTPTYVSLANNALVKCGSLYNNGTSWSGPTTGYAALDITDQIDFLNWEQDAPATGGYFENNIYVRAGTWNNVPLGNGYQQTDSSDEYNHSLSIADYKFWKIIANCRGNGGVVKVGEGSKELLPPDPDFELGINGCSPGFYGDDDTPTPPSPNDPTIPIKNDDPSYTRTTVYWRTSIQEQGRVFCEDLGVVRASDIDFNDIVFDAWIYKHEKRTKIEASTSETGPFYLVSDEADDSETYYDADIYILAGGGTLPASVAGFNVKNTFGTYVESKTIVNTILATDGAYGNDWMNFQKVKAINGDTPYKFTNVSGVPTIGDIKIIVQHGTEFAELTAYKGMAPHKICVPITTVWPKERAEINTAYPAFTKYVKYQDASGNYLNNPGVDKPEQVGDGTEQYWDEKNNTDVWDNPVVENLFTGTVSYTPRSVKDSIVEGPTVTATGSAYNGDPVLVRIRH